jgi:chromate transporter
MALVALLLGPHHVLFQIGAFFAKLATVTFGGAYAVLAYMAQEAVATHHWLKPGEMVDGLGLAETTPGPLILVTEFVGFLAAFRAPAPFYPLAAGIIGAVLTVWMTFCPCFLWIFTGAPFIELLEHARRIQGALAAVTAAVVGVIANLTVWFGLHVLFRQFTQLHAGGLHLALPIPASIDWTALGLSAVAALLLFRFHLGVIRTLGACILLALGLYLLGVPG